MSVARESIAAKEPEVSRTARNVVYGILAICAAAVAVASFAPEIKTAIRSIEARIDEAQTDEAHTDDARTDQVSREAGASEPEQSNTKESRAQKTTTWVLASYAFFIPVAILLLALIALAFKFHPGSWHISLPHYATHAQ